VGTTAWVEESESFPFPAGVKVKVEKDKVLKPDKLAHVTCFGCGKTGHYKRQCTEKYNTLIPERLASRLRVTRSAKLDAVGHKFEVKMAMVKVWAGPVDVMIEAAIVPDEYCTIPLLGMDIGENVIFDAISRVRQLRKEECREQQQPGTKSVSEPVVQAVQTRAQCNVEEKAEQQVEGTRPQEQVQ